MNDLTFRRATADDLPAIVAMLADDDLGRHREDPVAPLHANYLDAFRSMVDDRNQVLTVAESDGNLVGCLQITFVPGLSRLGMWRGQIESVRIASAFRGNGFERAMFEWAIERCRQRGCGLVQLTTDKSRGEAKEFYENLGFEASHEGLKLML